MRIFGVAAGAPSPPGQTTLIWQATFDRFATTEGSTGRMKAQAPGGIGISISAVPSFRACV
jgi:hypothetical protein